MRRRGFFATALLLAAAPLASPQEQSLIDDQGQIFRSAAPPVRIVSLAPNVTEILFGLGLENRISGVTRFCDYPPEAGRKPKVGGLVDPSPEMIQSLRPDLVIAFRGNPLRTIDRLRAIGLPVFVFNIGSEIDSIFPLIEKIGRVTRRDSEAAALIFGLRARLDAVRERLLGAAETPRVFLALQGGGLWTCGRKSYINDLIVKCGAVNVAGGIDRDWIHYNLEQIVRDDPEVIVILAKSKVDFERSRDRFLGDRRLRRVAAVRNRRVFELDENITSRFGPRLVTAIEKIAREIHPGLFGGRP